MGAFNLVDKEQILIPELRKKLFKIILIIAKEHEIYIDCLNGVEDHIHLLVRLRTDQTIAEIVKTIKGNSWEHFKENTENYITWQGGYAAFSVSPGNLKAVRSYIYRQELHHKGKNFTDEMKSIKAEVRLHQ